MTLEDRLQRGFDQHDADTANRLGAPDALPPFEPRPRGLAVPVASVAVGIAVLVAVGALLIGRPTIVGEDLSPASPSITTSPTTTEPSPTSTTTTSSDNEAVTTLVAPAAEATVTEPSSVASTTTTAPTTTEPTTTEPTTAPTTTAPTTTAPTSSTPETPATYVAIANSECASGFRAPLEQATLRYVGANQGWGRIADLVDEQDGPFYFEAWEPGYPDDVTVEVALAEPVRATEIRVAQDPFTPVSGAIDIDSAIGSGAIQLSGTEGWRSLELPTTSLLTSFTIRRDAESENVMEVLVCVQDPAN